MSTSIIILLAVICGVAVTLQGQFMGVMDQTMGTRESVFVTYAGGGFVAALMMLAYRGGNLKAWTAVPWYMFTSGLLGLVVVGTIGITVSKIGAAKAFTLIVASQFLLAALVDHYGLFAAPVRELDLMRISGLGVMLVGVWMVVR